MKPNSKYLISLFLGLCFSIIAFAPYWNSVPKAWYLIFTLICGSGVAFGWLLFEIAKTEKQITAKIIFAIILGVASFFHASNAITFQPGCGRLDCRNIGFTAGAPFQVYYPEYSNIGYFFGQVNSNNLLPISINVLFSFIITVIFIWLAARVAEAQTKEYKISIKQLSWAKSGFTLIELMVVVAIISLVSSILLVNLQDARKKGRDAKRIGDFRQLQTAIEIYKNNLGIVPNTTGINFNGRYPDTVNENENVGSPAGVPDLPCHNNFDTDIIDWNGDGSYWLTPLTSAGIISTLPRDPTSKTDYCGAFPSLDYSYGYRYKWYLGPVGTCQANFGMLVVMLAETNNKIGYTPPRSECDPAIGGWTDNVWIKIINVE